MLDEIFKSKGLKLTNSRKEIYNIIKDNNELSTIKNIIKKCSNINTVTVYRIIDTFLEKGLIDKKISIDNEVFYEIKPIDHSHYISCLKCHKKEKIEDKYIIEFEEKIAKDYNIIHHDIEFVGICSKCGE